MKKISLITGALVFSFILSGCMGISKAPEKESVNVNGDSIHIETPDGSMTVDSNGINVQTPDGNMTVDSSKVQQTVKVENASISNNVNTGGSTNSVVVSGKNEKNTQVKTAPSNTLPSGVDLDTEITCKIANTGTAYAQDGYAGCTLHNTGTRAASYELKYNKTGCSISNDGRPTTAGKVSCKYSQQTNILEASDGISSCKVDITNKKVIYNSPASSCEIDVESGIFNKTVK